MKNLFKVLILSCCLLMVNEVLAQTKVGHINSVELLSNLPEWKAAEAEMKTFGEKLDEQLKAAEQKLLSDYEAFMKLYNSGGVTPADAQVKEQEFQKRQQELEQQSTQAQRDYMTKEEQKLSPIRERVLTAIDAVARENGYDYILDISVGSVLFFENGDDISAKVKAKL